jgi:hypothetical protein
MMQTFFIMHREIAGKIQFVKFVSGVRTNVCAISINDYLYHMNELKKSYGQNLIAVLKINKLTKKIKQF